MPMSHSLSLKKTLLFIWGIFFSDLLYSTPPSSLLSGTMRKQQQTTKYREALFSIWYSPYEEERCSLLPEATGLHCNYELALGFAMPTSHRHTDDTQPWVAESHGGVAGTTEPSVERVLSWQPLVCSRNMLATNTSTTVTLPWWDTDILKLVWQCAFKK